MSSTATSNQQERLQSLERSGMLETLTWKEGRSLFHERQVALVPVGATEQHGPHLPLGTDFMIVSAIATEVAKHGGFVSTPVVPVGSSYHHRQFWGTLWVSPATLMQYLLEIARSLKYHGIDRLIFVNGHGAGNTFAVQECRQYLREEGVTALVYEWWYAVRDLTEELFEKPAGHADEIETSLMMAVAPSLVRSECFSEAEKGAVDSWGVTHFGAETYFDTIDFSPNGAIGRPTLASAEKGKRLFEASCKQLLNLAQWLTETDELTIRNHVD